MYLFHRESGGKILQASQRLAPHTHTRETDNKKSREAVGLATQSQALLKPFKAKGFRLLQSVLTS